MLVKKLSMLTELFIKLEFIKLLLLVPGTVNVLYIYIYIEVERLPWLIVTMQSKKTCGYSTVTLILGCLPFKYDGILRFACTFYERYGSLYILTRFDPNV